MMQPFDSAQAAIVYAEKIACGPFSVIVNRGSMNHACHIGQWCGAWSFTYSAANVPQTEYEEMA
jgi:hypothetical protein